MKKNFSKPISKSSGQFPSHIALPHKSIRKHAQTHLLNYATLIITNNNTNLYTKDQKNSKPKTHTLFEICKSFINDKQRQITLSDLNYELR